MRATTLLLSTALIAGGAAFAKMPPPTPEEQAAAAQKKQTEAEQVAKEKEALERAMNRVAERYHREKGSSAGPSAAPRPDKDDLPKTVKEPNRGVGPSPGMPTSGEAHSAPVK